MGRAGGDSEAERLKKVDLMNWVDEVFRAAVNELYKSICVIHSLLVYLMHDQRIQQGDWFCAEGESPSRHLSNKMKGMCQSLFFSLPAFSEILYYFFLKTFDDFNNQARQRSGRATNISLDDNNQIMNDYDGDENDDRASEHNDGFESGSDGDGDFVNVTLSYDDALFYTKVFFLFLFLLFQEIFVITFFSSSSFVT